jgi:hypothetical protein
MIKTNIILLDDLINLMFEKEIIYFNNPLTDYQTHKTMQYQNHYYPVLRSLCFEVNTLYQYLELKLFLKKVKKLIDILNTEQSSQLRDIKKRVLYIVIETVESIVERIESSYEYPLRYNNDYVFLD